MPPVSRAEIQSLVRERLATEAVIKTDGWQGYSFLDTSPDLQHEWLVPGSGKEAPKVLPWVHTLIANIKGNIRGIHHGVSPKHLPRYLGEFCYRFNRRFWEPQMFNRNSRSAFGNWPWATPPLATGASPRSCGARAGKSTPSGCIGCIGRWTCNDRRGVRDAEE